MCQTGIRDLRAAEPEDSQSREALKLYQLPIGHPCSIEVEDLQPAKLSDAGEIGLRSFWRSEIVDINDGLDIVVQSELVQPS
jgi:hypothetical protein